MNSVPAITAGSITAITGLANRPVFFLTIAPSLTPNLVVKGEAAAHAGITDADALVSIKWGSKLMKNVNNSLVNTKIMTAAEIAVFKTAALAAFPANSRQRNNVSPGAPAYKWVKMPLVQGLSDAEYYDDNGVNSNLIKANIVKFQDDNVWYDLGKVVAVDIFNGNSDRFDIVTGDWVNKGNVMFLAGGATAVIGLDTFDPNGTASANLNQRPAGALQRANTYEALKVLRDAGPRKTFAEACARSVGAQMKRHFLTIPANKGKHSFGVIFNMPTGPHPARIMVETMQDLFLPYANDFERGLVDGAAELKQYLQQKVRQYSVWHRANVQAAPPVAPLAFRMGARGAAAPAPLPHLPPPPPPAQAHKAVPQGILDRMSFLGWQV